MIRLTLLAMLVGFLAVYAWRDWYKALLGLILITAVIEHPDMPKTMLGIQGLNPWNILLACIIMAWFVKRTQEGMTWDFPRHIKVFLFLYLSVLLIAFLRMLGDVDGLIEFAIVSNSDVPTTKGLVSEHLINSLKWVIPGLLLFDGCRSRSQCIWALAAILGMYFFLAIQVIKWMPLDGFISGEDLSERSAKVMTNEIGFHRVNLSMMLAGASWAVFSTRVLTDKRRYVFAIIAVSLIILFAQALTGGRTGYGTWIVVGVILMSLRWRKYLMVLPIVLIVMTWLVPAALDRMSQGFSGADRDYNTRLHAEDVYFDNGELHWYTITAGRNLAWPLVIKEIGEAYGIPNGMAERLARGD